MGDRTFIVASNSGFIVTVPENCVDFSRCTRVKWAVKPISLFCKRSFTIHNGKSQIVIACSDGSYCQISLSTDGNILPSPHLNEDSSRSLFVCTILLLKYCQVYLVNIIYIYF